MKSLMLVICTVFSLISQENLSQLTWLSGHWKGIGLGGTSEEFWSFPDKNGMFGTFKQMNDNNVVFYEFFALTKIDNKWSLKLKHFTPELKGWESKEKYVEFPVLKMTGDILECKGMVYKKISNDEIEAEVIIDSKGGPKKEVFKFKRIK